MSYFQCEHGVDLSGARCFICENLECTGKVKYETEKEARKAAKFVMIYQCPHCNKWHVK
jgi:hypothetical protein